MVIDVVVLVVIIVVVVDIVVAIVLLLDNRFLTGKLKMSKLIQFQ